MPFQHPNTGKQQVDLVNLGPSPNFPTFPFFPFRLFSGLELLHFSAILPYPELWGVGCPNVASAPKTIHDKSMCLNFRLFPLKNNNVICGLVGHPHQGKDATACSLHKDTYHTPARYVRLCVHSKSKTFYGRPCWSCVLCCPARCLRDTQSMSQDLSGPPNANAKSQRFLGRHR